MYTYSKLASTIGFVVGFIAFLFSLVAFFRGAEIGLSLIAMGISFTLISLSVFKYRSEEKKSKEFAFEIAKIVAIVALIILFMLAVFSYEFGRFVKISTIFITVILLPILLMKRVKVLINLRRERKI